MLKNINLTREVSKADYKRLKGEADLKLAALQRQAKALGIPIIVVVEGWSAAGKGTLINEMILPLDPRGFSVYSARGPTEEDAFYPFLRRFWNRTPTRGRLAIFDRSWNRRVLTDRVSGLIKGERLRQAFDDTMKDPQFLAEAEKLDLPVIGPIQGAEAERIVASIYAASPTLIARAQEIVGK